MSDKISARENEASSEAGSSAQDAATANSDTTANAQDAPSNSVAGLGNTNPGSSGRAVMLPHPKSLPTVQVAFRKGTVYIGSSPTKHSFSLAKGPRAGMNGNALPNSNGQLSRMDFFNEEMHNMHNFHAVGDAFAGAHGNDLKQQHVVAPQARYDELPLTPVTPTVSGYEVNLLRNDIKSVQATTVINGQEVVRLQDSVSQLTASHHKVLQYIQVLNTKVEGLENKVQRLGEENNNFRDWFASRGFQLPQNRIIADPTPSLSPVPQNRHEQQSPMEDVFNEQVESAAGKSPVATPSSTNTGALSLFKGASAPISPKKASPKKASPKKAYTLKTQHSFTSKRKVHNLSNMLPPPMTIIPLVPLTDKEIVVYFFNSLSRPHVAVRLYARGWGPAKIVDVLNSHRTIQPPYLRNTCSVKCTTAQKRGIEKYGQAWDAQMRKALKEADDAHATRLIEIDEDECDEPMDVHVSELLKGLKKHPGVDEEDEEISIFTQCVMWCEENQRDWLVSDIHELAQALQEGRSPVGGLNVHGGYDVDDQGAEQSDNGDDDAAGEPMDEDEYEADPGPSGAFDLDDD